VALFAKRAVQLPVTSYGYAPPTEATARGWQCNNYDCGTGDEPAPRSWPFHCPLCGGLADPDFDEPWHEEARGPRLQVLLNRENGGGAGHVYEAALWAWSYGRALAAGNIPESEQIRAQASAWLTQIALTDPYLHGSATRQEIVSHALTYGQVEAAAGELRAWHAQADTSNVADSSVNRSNCIALLHSELRFLEDARGAYSPAAAQVAADARNLGAAIQRELPLDLQQRWGRLR